MKIVLFVMLFFCLLFGVEIDIKKDNDTLSVSQEDVTALRDYIRDVSSFVINIKGAKKLVEENRILANRYLQSPLSPYDMARIKVMTEDYLAKAFIDRFQNQILQKDPKVLYSFYLDHIEKFKKSDKVDIVVFAFKTFQDALCFYEKAQNISDVSKLKRSAQNCRSTLIKEYPQYSFEKLHSAIKGFIKKDEKNYLTPPFVFGKENIRVLFIKSFKRAKGYKSFEKVKEDIKKELFNEAYIKYREELLEKMKK